MAALDFDFIDALSPQSREQLMQEVWDAANARVEAEAMSQPVFELRGNNLAIQSIEDEQVITHGPAGTGKSLAWLYKINKRMWAFPNLRVLIVRKVRADLAESVLNTFERDILGYTNPICEGAERENRAAYHYPNGSLISLGGMDRPGRFLSSEWDIIYVPECNQLTDEEWQLLWSRLARDGAYPTPQICGDTNPDRPDHWIQKRAKEGVLRLLITSHKDNAKYWNEKLQEWTALGLRYVFGRLAKLSGLLRKKFFEGLWVVAEGAVYDTYSADVHVKNDPWLIEQGWLKHSNPADENSPLVPGIRVRRVIASQDWGYKHPGSYQVWLIDGDGRMLYTHEVFMTRQVLDWWVDKAKEAKDRWGVEEVACDPSQPAAIEEYRRAGLHPVAAKNNVSDGITAVQNRLPVEGDGEPRILFRAAALDARDPLREDGELPCGLIETITGYVWKDKSKKDEPVKEDDDSEDAMRYAVMHVDGKPELIIDVGIVRRT